MHTIDSNFSDSDYVTYEIEGSYLIATYKEVNIDIGIAKHVVKQRLLFQNGNDYSSLADARQIRSATKEARDYLARHDEGLIASAILGGNSISNIIANMFLTFSKPKIPARVFQDREKAMKWLSQFESGVPQKKPRIRHIWPQTPTTFLTDFELTLLKSICAGKSSTEIGKLHHKSPRTIEEHREKIYKKFGVSKKEALILEAIKKGLI